MTANAVAVPSAKDRPWMGERAERLERRFERPMLVVAALVIPALIVEQANVGEGWKALASVLNWIIWLAFLGELVAMLAVARGIYWAVSTMTTVGYGDELPTTVEAKWVAMFLMLVGIGYFAVVTGAIAERFVERGEEERVEAIEAEAPDDLRAQVDRLALRARELVADLEALRLAMSPTHSPSRSDEPQ